MARPKGALDADHVAKRQSLLHKMTVRMMRREIPRPSLRNLAASADVSVPTLRHYFGDRSHVVDAILAECLRRGRPGLDAQAHSDLPFDQSVLSYARDLVAALTTPKEVRLGDIFAVSLAEGLLDEAVSGATLNHILEPTLEILEARLEHHIALGQMKPTDTRAAALMLLSPILKRCPKG